MASSVTLLVVGFIHTCDLLCVNYCVNYLLNNGLCYTKQAHSHLLFGQFLPGLISSIMGCAPIFFAITSTEKVKQ